MSRVGEAFKYYEMNYDDLPSLYLDMNHQSKYGAYLSACVYYCMITGRKASDNSFVNKDIEEDVAEIIKEVTTLFVLIKIKGLLKSNPFSDKNLIQKNIIYGQK